MLTPRDAFPAASETPTWGEPVSNAAPANQAITLRAFLLDIENVLRGIPAAWVKCELHKLSVKPKITYLELVETDDAGAIVAKVQAVVRAGKWRKITEAFAANGLTLEVGSRILIRVRPRLGATFGFDLEADDIDVNFALGDLAARVCKNREDLKAGGLYDRQRRLPGVADFRRVCVVAPPGAAGRADFRRVTDPLHNHRLVEIIHLDATFQSAAASASIRDALRSVFKDCQAGRFCAVTLIRGGGASADLAHLVCFDLCRAVCLMPVPVLVGIGHEVDRGLLDEVAHLSFPTPTAVASHIRNAVVSNAQAANSAIQAIQAHAATSIAHAENIVAKARADAREGARRAAEHAEAAVRAARKAVEPDARHSLDLANRRIAEKLMEARRAADAAREHAAEQIRAARAGIAQAVQRSLVPAERAMMAARATLESAPAQRVGAAEVGIALLRQAVMDGAEARVQTAGHGVAVARNAATALDPRRLLASGYAILRDAEGRPLTTTAALRAVPEIRAELADGTTTLRPVPTSD